MIAVSPFETIDRDGVGRLIMLAVAEAREAKPDLTIGVCGDPESIHFFAEAGLDYVSCSPLGVLVARFEAGRAEIGSLDSLAGGRRP